MNAKTKKILKVISVLLIIIMAFTIVSPVFAAITPSDMNGSSTVQTEDMKNFGNKIVGIIRAAGIILSVIMLMVIGIKYMLGSAEEKAEYKKTLMPYTIGAVLLLMASTVSGFIYSALGQK